MGQSPFAIARGQTFERALFRNQADSLFEGLKASGVVPGNASGLADLRLRMNGGRLHNLDDARSGTSDLLRDLASGRRGLSRPWLVAGATVRIPGGVMLPEAILVLDALVIDHSTTPCTLTVGEIKTYPDRGGYTDPQELATARAQAGVYVHGLELVLDELRLLEYFRVSLTGFLVLSRPGFNRPSVRAGEDLRYQAERAKRGFALLRQAAQGLPPGSGRAGVAEIITAPTNYNELCVMYCDRASLCRQKALAKGDGAVLGDDVARFLGSVPLHRALALMAGASPVTEAERDLQRRIKQMQALRNLP
jgi:hypothetical protein